MQFKIFKVLIWITFYLPYFNAILLEVFLLGRVRVNSSKENLDLKLVGNISIFQTILNKLNFWLFFIL